MTAKLHRPLPPSARQLKANFSHSQSQQHFVPQANLQPWLHLVVYGKLRQE